MQVMEKEVISHGVEETFEIAERFASELEAGAVVCLEGELGAGKTHFVKGMARNFGINPDEVSSPTYTLINEYDGKVPLFHFDCYRMKRLEEALEIGAEEYFYDEGVSVIEWPSTIKELLPEHTIWIKIKSLSSTERQFLFGKLY